MTVSVPMMPDPARLRDSTQIRLPLRTLETVEVALEAEFCVTVFEGTDHARIIGSPVEIKQVSDFLARRGVNLD